MVSEHTVNIDDDFYNRRLKPYRGCPKGAEGMPGNISIKEWLTAQKKNIINGTDEDFICIPSMLYDALIR